MSSYKQVNHRFQPATTTGSAPLDAGDADQQSSALFKTESGLDLTEELTQFLWLACEQGHADLSLIREVFSRINLTAEDLAGVFSALETAGLEFGGASFTVAPDLAVSEKYAQFESRASSGQQLRQQVAEVKARPRVSQADMWRRLKEADQETRRILYAFGFAAREHLVRAEKLLADPSQQRLDELVADSKIPDRGQYLKELPRLVNHVRALDHQAAAAWREWHQALDNYKADERRAEFTKLQRRLERALPGFCYQTKVVEEIVGFAQSLAGRFRGSLRIVQNNQRSREPMCQMPLVDVERQCIAAMEELVRMPCDVFVRSCAQLGGAQARFRQARVELIQEHLHLVPTIAGGYANRGLPALVLLRAGVAGLVCAVEKFEFRPDCKFKGYAACWIRQSMRDALATRSRHIRQPASAIRREKHKGSDHPERGEQDAAPGSSLASEIGNAAS